MSIAEILEQAQTLSVQERKELAKLLIDTLDMGEPSVELQGETAPEEHWGQKLVHMMDKLGAIEMIHPEIENATEWVKQIRRDQELQRGMDWDEAE